MSPSLAHFWLAREGDNEANVIYLDHAASSPPSQQTLDFYLESLKRDIVNPAAGHSLARQQAEIIEKSRDGILKALYKKDSSTSKKLIFTSSATESNNQVIKGHKESLIRSGRKAVFFSCDHPSVVRPHLDTYPSELLLNFSHPRELLDSQTGRVRKEILKESLDWGLISLTEVNSQSGEILDIASVANELKNANPAIIIHVDGVQALGKTRFSLDELNIDSYCFSSHKMGGPKGVAGLVLCSDMQPSPLLSGGGHQGGLRASTESSALGETLAYVLGRSLSQNSKGQLEQARERCHSLRDELCKQLGERIYLPFADRPSSPYILTVVIAGVPSDVLLRHLEQKDIFTSSSSACSSKKKKENPIFNALGIPLKYHQNVLRISQGDKTTSTDLNIFVRELVDIIEDISFLISN